MKGKSPVFEKTYRVYLKRLAAVDLKSRAETLGGGWSKEGLIIPFYGTPHRISPAGVTIADGGHKATFAVRVVLCNYVLRCPVKEPHGEELVTYREFRDAGPLIGYFANNTNKVIEQTFTGRLKDLTEACQRIGGKTFTDGSAYDLSMKFNSLPKIPVYLRFNDGDEEFPAQASILFHRSAEAFLDMESLAIAGTFLAGHLIAPL